MAVVVAVVTTAGQAGYLKTAGTAVQAQQSLGFPAQSQAAAAALVGLATLVRVLAAKFASQYSTAHKAV